MPQSCFSRRNPAATLRGRLCWWTAESRLVQRERCQVLEWQAENNRQTQRRGSGNICVRVEFQGVKRVQGLVRCVRAETHSRQCRSRERSWPPRTLRKRNSLP